jgi:hypothetical protein
MGLWDNVKNIAVSVKCITGWHAGEYTPIADKPECHVSKTCPDCNKYLTAVNHKFGEWKFLDIKCDAQRECIYCFDYESKIIHNYEEIKDFRCRVSKVCIRCGDEQIGSIEHKWVLIDKGKRRICKDCRREETIEE